MPDVSINAGFVPLLDCAPLLIAARGGFAQSEGVALTLSRETSWATIRDRLSIAHLDVAHALAPLPLAANLGLGPLGTSMIVPICFGTGANTVTLARSHWDAMRDLGPPGDLDPNTHLQALRAWFGKQRDEQRPPPVFGIVHPHSAHRYQLAYWLASAGLIPGRDVDFMVLPPALMPQALASGRIDGFCAGEPWGAAAVASGSGVILTTNAHIWRGSPEKVLAVNATWAEGHTEALLGLVRAIDRACAWCDDPANAQDLTKVLADSDVIGAHADLIGRSLTRALPGPDGTLHPVEGFLRFAGSAVNFPWVSHAQWFASQMVRWGDLAPDALHADTIAATWRPDIYRAALADGPADLPMANAKVEGALRHDTAVGSSRGRLHLAPDGFFDGRVFDPDDVAGYTAALRAADAAAKHDAPQDPGPDVGHDVGL
ncbi:MAG: CmpA/NrtA family ABC transporter substrate-binding protein [Pseudomonadota bacterium]